MIAKARITEIKFAIVFGNLALCSRKFVTGNNKIERSIENINGTTTVCP